ncbi:Xylose isomerase domain protein TIM barrel [Bacteroides ovatus]|jgi:AP endonuclease, family 2|uniref:sugar phosphate isomerase/epimerase family protein n=1 Tax=Bacteroides TaxID=816 RepID=UPI001F1716C4|nr:MULTISPECIES: sugar phosphate isomerase/epimerase family protein [Bacteroides]CAG9888702.1 Xylose isomerase domain protein TIM barrel [Bacteroides ovatus]
MIKKRLLLIATLLILSIGCIFAQGRRQSNKTVNTNRPTGAPIEHFKKFDTSAPYVKVALNAYSFTKNLNDYIKGRSNDPMTLFDLIDFCAVNKIDALDATGYFFVGYPDVPTDKYIYEVKKYAFCKGVDISGTGIMNNFANPDATARAKDVQRVKDWIDVAAKLGAPVLRIFSGPVPKGYEDRWDEVVSWMIPCFKEVAKYGESKGVMVGVQNHGDMMATGEQTVKVLKAVKHPWFGLILDTGYFHTEDPYRDMEMCLDYAINWQIKESALGRESMQPLDLKKVMKMIRKVGYRGYLPVETLSVPGRPYEPFKLVPEFVGKVRKVIEEEFAN